MLERQKIIDDPFRLHMIRSKGVLPLKGIHTMEFVKAFANELHMKTGEKR